uniref:Uncharacterized protein n=1 Tax=Trichogramma kaykai TaxID=54128 RepID=A0ABD2VYJ5_9HYME
MREKLYSCARATARARVRSIDRRLSTIICRIYISRACEALGYDVSQRWIGKLTAWELEIFGRVKFSVDVFSCYRTTRDLGNGGAAPTKTRTRKKKTILQDFSASDL